MGRDTGTAGGGQRGHAGTRGETIVGAVVATTPSGESVTTPCTGTAHRRLAGDLAALTPDGNEALIAGEYRAAGDTMSWARWTRLAADAAYTRGGHRAALPHLMALLSAWAHDDLAAAAGPLVLLELETAFCALETEQPDLARSLAERVLMQEGLTPAQHASAALTRAGALTTLADPQARRAAMDAAAEARRLPQDRDRARLLCLAARVLLGHDSHQEAATLAEEALADASGTTTHDGFRPGKRTPAWVAAAACVLLGTAYSPTDAATSRAWFARAATEVATIEDRLPQMRGWLYHAEAAAYLLQGRLDEAINEALVGQTWLSQQEGCREWAPRLAAVIVEAMIQLGRLQGAMALIEAWRTGPLSTPNRAELAMHEARIAVLEDRLEDARSVLDAWAEVAGSAGCAPTIACAWLELSARVECAGARPSRAARVALRTAERVLESSPMRSGPTLTLAVWSAAHASRSVRDEVIHRVRALADASAPRAEEVTSHWRSLIAAELASDPASRLQAWTEASRVFRRRRGPEEARLYAFLGEASARLTIGDVATAHDLADEAEARMRSSGIVSLAPVLARLREQLGAPGGPPGRRLGLSVREFEVLKLVAQGMSNREIASRLSISPRTADVHVSRILSKLGASSRTHAMAIALRRGSLTTTDMIPDGATEAPPPVQED